MDNIAKEAQLIWNIADLLRGGWKQHEYQDVILPLVVLKRLDSILAPTKDAAVAKHNEYAGKLDELRPILKTITGVDFYNSSLYDFQKLLNEPNSIAKNLDKYIKSYSQNIQEIFGKFDFDRQLDRLAGGDMLYRIISELNKIDLSTQAVDNHKMGLVFEELIRKFAEQSNETAGEHYTPRDVIKLAVEVLFYPDRAELSRQDVIKKIYDCACGTGGMLTLGKEHILSTVNDKAGIYLFGQELNPVTYAVCKADMLIKGEDPDRIKGGDKDSSKASTLSNDQFFGEEFDYLLTNPPFGVDWKKDKDAVEREAERGYAGRFGAGLPRISDGQLLFLQHMISKMRRAEEGGARLGIVFNGSPLFSGDAGSGESEIRRWVLEKDLLETIIALPDQLFYNTGISTYLWFLTNRKPKERAGKVQLVDGRGMSVKMRKSLGNKRNQISDKQRAEIIKLYANLKEGEFVKIFNTTDFGYRQIQVERPLRLNLQASAERLARLKESKIFDNKTPSKKKGEVGQKENQEWLELRENIYAVLEKIGDKLYVNRETFIVDLQSAFKSADLKVGAPLLKTIWQELSERDETADICQDKDGHPEPDAELRDYENVPYGEDVRAYFEREVRSYAPDAWINESVRDHKDNELGVVGYEIPFTRYFYKYQAPRPLEEIEAEIEGVENELLELLKKL